MEFAASLFRLLLDPDGAPLAAARLGRAGAERTERVVVGAAGAVVQRGGGQRPALVVPAERTGTEVAER